MAEHQDITEAAVGDDEEETEVTSEENEPASKLSDWFTKTGLPTVALSLYTDKAGKLLIKMSGHPGFSDFATNETVCSEFLRAATNIQQSQLQQINEPSDTNIGINQALVDTFRNENVLEMNVDSKRKIVTATVLGNSTKKRKLWREEFCPTWWPSEVPFCSPSQAPKFTVELLDVVLERFQNNADSITGQGEETGEIVREEEDVGGHNVEEIEMGDQHLADQNEEVLPEVPAVQEVLIISEIPERLSYEEAHSLERIRMTCEAELFSQLVPIDNGHLCYLITTDDVIQRFEEISDDVQRLSLCAKEEIMRTGEYYRYGWLLHMILASCAFKVNLVSFSTDQLLCQEFAQENSTVSIKIMWVPSTLNGVINHVIPLVNFGKEEREDLEDDGECDIAFDGRSLCMKSFGRAPAPTTVKCFLCLREYHTDCAVVSSVENGQWSCCCHIKIENLACMQTFKSLPELKRVLNECPVEINQFLSSIIKGKKYCPRISLFHKRVGSVLRKMLATGLFNDETWVYIVEYSIRISNQVAKYKNLNISMRITLNISVFAPEIAALIIQKLEGLPLICCRRLVILE
eukprot:gene6491-7235_t